MSRTHPQTTTSPSSHFQQMFNNAMKAYEKRTKNDLLLHPLAAQLQACDSPDAILAVLQKQVEEFNQSRDTGDRWTKWLDPTVNVLFAFSATFGEGVGLVFSPAKLIFAGVGVLLLAVKDVRASQEALVDIFERIESFFRRLEVYTQMVPTREMMDIIIQIMVEVLSILGIATKEIKQGRTKKYFKKLVGRTDLEDALRRLDKLTQEELRMATAEALKVTHTVDARVRAVDDKITGAVKDAQVTKRNQLWERLHKWLSPPDPSTNHNIACRTHHKRTASWFFQGTIFGEWKTSGSLLWIHGKPGSGKSILCSTIIQDIEAMCEAGNASMNYFYFDFRDANKQNLEDLVRSLLTPLSARSDPRYDILSRLYESHDRGTKQPGDDILTRCLNQMLSIPDQRQIYLIIDALDECPDSSGIPSPRERILQLLKELVELNIPNLHICVTSRPEIDIRDVLDPLTSSLVSLHDQSGQKKDIVDYVKSVVYSDSEPIMKRWRTEDKDLVISTLSERADGMFRWVYCQLEVLRHCLPPSVRRTLNELPESLDATYERLLREMKKPNRDRALHLLQCLVVAIRPLRVNELAEVLAVDFDDAEGMAKLNSSWRWEDQEQALLSSCSSLISIVDDGDDDNHRAHDSRVVQFSHFSVKEFLISSRLATPNRDVSYYYIDLEPAHMIMAQACLSVLLRSDVRVDHVGIGDNSPLKTYAAEHWATHAQFKDVSSYLRQPMECLFDVDRPYFASWLELHDIDIRPLYNSPFFQLIAYSKKSPAGPIYYAALCGFRDLAEHLTFKNSQGVNASGGYYVTPCIAALAGRHFQLAYLLHCNGSSVDTCGPLRNSPLHSASHFGDLEIIRILLEYGADVNAQNHGGATPLHWAMDGRLPEVVCLLLGQGADPNISLYDGRTTLHRAVDVGSAAIVRLLLGHDVDVDAVDKNSRTAPQCASERGYDEIMTLLLAHGANVSHVS